MTALRTESFDTLFKALRKGEVPGSLYLHGPEEVLKEEIVAEILDRTVDPSLRDFNYDQRSAASLDPEQAETLCTTLPMMADKRVVVIRDVESWNKRAKAKAAVLRYLGRPALETVLVLVQGGSEDDVDADLAAKTLSVRMDHLPSDRAQRWLVRRAEQLGVALEDSAAEHLVKVTGGGLSDIRSELDKLAGLGGGAPLTLDRVAALLGIRHGETQADWRDLVLEGQVGRAVSILPHLLAQTGVSGVGLVALLGPAVTGIGLARTLLDRGTRGAALVGAIKQALFRTRPPYRFGYDQAAAQWARLAPQWPLARIEAAFIALRRADERLKTTAVSDERAILFDLCMELVLPWQRAA